MIKTLVSPCSGFGSQKIKFDRSGKKVKPRAVRMELTITQPDDWHLHLRDGDLLHDVVPHSASNFKRAIVMPNLKPPVTTTEAAITYRESIMKALPHGSSFDPLMTLYMTDKTHPDELDLKKHQDMTQHKRNQKRMMFRQKALGFSGDSKQLKRLNQMSGKEGRLAAFLQRGTLSYAEIPTKYVWNPKEKIWSTTQGEKITDRIFIKEKVEESEGKNKC